MVFAFFLHCYKFSLLSVAFFVHCYNKSSLLFLAFYTFQLFTLLEIFSPAFGVVQCTLQKPCRHKLSTLLENLSLVFSILAFKFLHCQQFPSLTVSFPDCHQFSLYTSAIFTARNSLSSLSTTFYSRILREVRDWIVSTVKGTAQRDVRCPSNVVWFVCEDNKKFKIKETI